MNNHRLSIIIPIFNVERYITRCLESVLNQNINYNEYEIIIVDDCSPDASINIVSEFQKKYGNIYIVSHGKNRGLGAARNTGLDNANGKYVWFIDSDDFIEQNCLKYVLNKLEDINLDILSFNFYKQKEGGIFVKDIVNKDSFSDINTGPQFMAFNYQPTTFSSCSKIYRTKFLKINQLRFTEGVFWEDADFVLRAIYKSSRILFVKNHLYYYCFNQQSISNNSLSGKNYADLVKMGARKLAFANSIEKESPDLALKIKEDAAWNATTVKKILLLNSTERLHFYHLLEDQQYAAIKSVVKSHFFRFLYQYPILTSIILFFTSPFINLIKKSRG